MRDNRTTAPDVVEDDQADAQEPVYYVASAPVMVLGGRDYLWDAE